MFCIVPRVNTGMDQLPAPGSNAQRQSVAACPASLRFRERGRPEATIIPACRARHGHHRALYTSVDSQLTIGLYSLLYCQHYYHYENLYAPEYTVA